MVDTQPNTAQSSPIKSLGKQPLFFAGVAIVVVVVAGLSYWAYRQGNLQRGISPSAGPAKSFFGTLNLPSFGTGKPSAPAAVPKSNSPAVSVAVPTPTPTPRPTGPGPQACDPYSVCNVYKDPTKSGCPVTFADRYCLDRCQDPSTHCKQ